MANEQAKASIYLDGKQAEAVLDSMTRRAKELKKEFKAAQEAGDNIKMNKLEKELKMVESAQRSLRKETFDTQKVLKNLNGSSMDDLKKALGQTQKEWSRMAQTDPGYKEKTEQLTKLKAAVKDANGVLQQQTGFMGNLQSKLALMPGSLGSMAAGIMAVGKATIAFFLTPVGAILGIVAAVVMGVKALITNSREFGKAASSLSAITGAVGKDLDFLKKKAREISKDSTQSATDMLKAFQTIGGAMPELLKNGPLLAEVTRNAVMLSEASGGELSVTDAAKAAAAALNQFNIPLTESARAVNVLAAGSLAGSAEVDNITESLKNLGPVADGANMTLENTVAIIELVAEKGILGAEAGTKLRGVILKLQAESLGYASGQFNLKDAIDEANRAIDAQGTAMEKDAYMAKLFGIENITAGRIVLENADKYVQLTKAVTGTNTAYEQARTQMNNLDGSYSKFSGAWKNMMLAIEDGNGMLATSWKWIVDGATWLINGMTVQFENLGASIRAIGIVFVNFYDQMKTPVMALGRLLKAVFTMDFADMAPALAAFKSSFAEIGKDGSLNLGKIALEQLKIGQASKEATALLKLQKKELEELANAKRILTKEQIEDAKKASEKLAEFLGKSAIEQQDAINKYFHQAGEGAFEAFMKAIEEKQKGGIDFSMIPDLPEEEEKKDPALDYAMKNMGDNPDFLALQYKAGIIGKQEYEDKLSDITKKAEEERFKVKEKKFQDAQALVSFGANFVSALMDMELQAAGDNEEKKMAIKKKYANAQFLVAASQIVVSTSLAIMQALAQLGPIAGAIAAGIIGATGAVQLVTANKERQKMQGYADGGFTKPGDKKEPAGIVHAGEYVIPQDGVNNAQLRPVIDLIEIARRNGSLARLDLRPVVASIGGGSGYSSGGSVGFSTNTSPAPVPSIQTNESGTQFTPAQIDKLNGLLERMADWDPAISIELLERRQNLYKKITKGGLKG